MQGNVHADPEIRALLVQDAVEVQGQPAKVREQFVKKTIVLVGLQLVIAIGLASPVLFKCVGALRSIFTGCGASVKVIHVLTCVVLALQFIHCCYTARSLQPGRRQYMKMFVTPPWNYLWMAVYAVMSGLVMAFCTWTVGWRTAVILAVVYVLIAAVLSAFAVFTEFDASTVNLTWMLLGCMVATCCILSFHAPKVFERILDVFWVGFFLTFLVQHTQLIFGTARPKEQSLQYTIDMYGYAAYVLYCIYINTYFALLRAFQVEPWRDALMGGLCPGEKASG